MNRKLAAVAMCGAIGTVLTLVAAWGPWLLLGMPVRPGPVEFMPADASWRSLVPPEFPTDGIMREDGFGRTVQIAAARIDPAEIEVDRSGPVPVYTSPTPVWHIQVYSVGWPVRCIEGAIIMRRDAAWEFPGLVEVPRGFPGQDRLQRSARAPQLLPVRVRVFEAAGNTVFFGIAAGLAWFGVRSGLRAIRWRTGRCTRCGYDVRGLGGCPECGPEKAAAGEAGRPA